MPFTRPTLQCVSAGNTKGGSIPVPFTSCLPSLDLSVLQIKTEIVSCHTADSKPAEQEVNSTVIVPPLVFPGFCIEFASESDLLRFLSTLAN